MPLHPAEVAAGPAAGTSGVPPDAGAGSAQVKAALPVPPPLLRRASDTPHVVVAGGVLVDHEHIDEVARLDMSAAE
jgi:hypothetical protein